MTREKFLKWTEKCPSVEWAGPIKFNHGFLVTTQTDQDTLNVMIYNPGHSSGVLRDHSRLQRKSTGVYLRYRPVGTQIWNDAQMIVKGAGTQNANFIVKTTVENDGYIALD